MILAKQRISRLAPARWEMPLIVPQDGMKYLANLFGTAFFNSLRIGLFTGPLIPSYTTILTDIQEATFPGYSRKLVPPWSLAAINPFGAGYIVPVFPISWTSSADSLTPPVTGYFFVILDSLLVVRLVGVERFNANIPTNLKDKTVQVTPPFSVGSFF